MKFIILCLMIFTSINAYSAGSYQDTFHIGLPFSGQDVFLDLGDTGAFKWDVATSKLQFSNDGASYTDIGAGGSGGGVDEWVTATDYVIGNIVWESPTNSIYRALTIHTSSVFATDLASGDWQILGDGVGLPLMAKGSLIGSNGTNNGEFAKCPDGEFLIWDDSAADGTGMVCSGSASGTASTATALSATGVISSDSNIIGANLYTENDVLYNYNTGVAQTTSLLMYPSGGTNYQAYLSKSNGGVLSLWNGTDSNTIFYTNAVVRVTIPNNGGLTIHGDGSGSGNVPHQCAYTATNSNVAAINYYCPDVTDIVVAGGCSTADASETLIASHPTSNMNGWSCQSQAGSSTDLYVRMICCQY